jgi:hypothetical protein
MLLSALGGTNWITKDINGNPVEQLNLLLAAGLLTPDGSDGGPGFSGSGVFKQTPDGKVWQVGIVSANTDWGSFINAGNPTSAQAVFNGFETEFNADLDPFASVQGIYTTPPSAATGAQYIPVITP